jgi:hypothetical protein
MSGIIGRICQHIEAVPATVWIGDRHGAPSAHAEQYNARANKRRISGGKGGPPEASPTVFNRQKRMEFALDQCFHNSESERFVYETFEFGHQSALD